MKDVRLIPHVFPRNSSLFLRVLFVLVLCIWSLTFNPDHVKGSSLSASILPTNFQESVVFNNGLSLPPRSALREMVVYLLPRRMA